MSDLEFQKLMEEFKSTDNSSPAPRKRLLKQNGQSGGGYRSDTNIDVLLPELDFNDPNFLQLLKEYDNEFESTPEDREKELRALRAQAKTKPLLDQNSTYLLIVVLVGLFVVGIHWYNSKELERLKEEFGFDVKQVLPEYWWRKGLIYHIYVQSFQDSNGDGIGDINGIRQRLDHFTYLGVDAVMLSSFFESPFEDFGKDVRNFKSVHTKCGSLEDFKKLVEELHARGIKVVIQLVPNHTSRRHKWFLRSRTDGLSSNFRNYYIWHKGRQDPTNGTRIPPNNWVSRYGGSAWTFDDERREFYYHYYHTSMPDLNHRNPHVRQEFLDIFRFWFDLGVDALHLDGIHVLYESIEIELDEPTLDNSNAEPNSYRSVSHVYTEDQPDLHDYLRTWREFVENYSTENGRRVGFLVDVIDSTVTDIIKYYFTGANAPVCHVLMNIHDGCGGRCIHEMIDAWMSRIPEDHDSIWMLSGPDYERFTKRSDVKYQNVFNILTMLLPGAVLSYYGDEIGLKEITLNYEDVKDYQTRNKGPEKFTNRARDFARAPMLWNSERNAGFTSGEYTWMPLQPDFPTDNVELQKSDSSQKSIIQIYQRLSRLRKERSFTNGKLQYSIINENILSFMRFSKDGVPYLIALNFGRQKSTDDYTLSAGVSHGKVVLHATSASAQASLNINEGDMVSLSNLSLEPGEGIVVILMMDVDFKR